MADMTLRETAAVLKKRGQTLALSYSHGQYHAYVFQGETMTNYDRADDLSESIERAIADRPKT